MKMAKSLGLVGNMAVALYTFRIERAEEMIRLLKLVLDDDRRKYSNHLRWDLGYNIG